MLTDLNRFAVRELGGADCPASVDASIAIRAPASSDVMNERDDPAIVLTHADTSGGDAAADGTRAVFSVLMRTRCRACSMRVRRSTERWSGRFYSGIIRWELAGEVPAHRTRGAPPFVSEMGTLAPLNGFDWRSAWDPRNLDQTGDPSSLVS